MQRAELQQYLDNLLEVGRFRIIAPNGLQVEGRDAIHRVVCGVMTASQALLRRGSGAAGGRGAGPSWMITSGVAGTAASPACDANAWRPVEARHQPVCAYHLPLDTHPELGNNAQLARLMGWLPDGRSVSGRSAGRGHLERPQSLESCWRAMRPRGWGRGLVLGDPARTVSG